MAMASSSCFFALVSLGLSVMGATGNNGNWEVAHATFYGDKTGSDAKQGACGYYDTINIEGFGLHTAALSSALFSEGQTCGSCYEIRCFNTSDHCHPGTITITGTNHCPPNWRKPSNAGGWCNPPRKHFDLTLPAYLKIGVYKAGIVPIQYRRVPCVKSGGIKFKIRDDSKPPYWMAVLTYNVADAGDIRAVAIKGSNSGWIEMGRSWGVVWQTGVGLVGQSLSFRVTTSNGKVVESMDVAPRDWRVGQTYEGKQVS